MSPSCTNCPSRSRRRSRIARRSDGFTIVELMIAVVIGLFLIAAASLVYIGNRRTTTTQKDLSQLAQSGAFAISNVSKLLQQAGQISAGGTSGNDAPGRFCSQATTPLASNATAVNTGGAIEGLDNAAPTSTIIGSSDQVLVRFNGSSSPSGAGFVADASITDCAGGAVDGSVGATSVADRTWAKLYVRTDASTGNPALFCTFNNSAGASATAAPVEVALVDNVESFQVLYGVGAWFSTTDPSATLAA